MATNQCSTIEPMLIDHIEVISDDTGLIVMMSITSIITVILLVGFIESITFVATKIPHRDRSISLIWMLAIYPIFAVTSQMGLFIPRAVLMCNLTASIFFSVSLYHFVQLIIYYYGGHDATVTKISEMQILGTLQLTEESFYRLKICIYQMALLRPVVLFIEDILWLNESYDTSSITINDAYVYLNLFTLLSSLVAIIALIILFLASREHLRAFFITIKFVIVGLAMYFSNIQILLFDVLTFTDVIKCSKPFDWETRGSSWQCLFLIVESALLFPIALKYFRTRNGNMVGVLEIPRFKFTKAPTDNFNPTFNYEGFYGGTPPANPQVERLRTGTNDSLPLTKSRSSSSIGFNSYITM
ncbi:organic solute transporter subunit alpha-like [Lytechinus pictus]|uniref:organic solute transporter subunit alpha-like n=1 Tax=Lytechinus pictus TaxID=7653 RepID=UPI00240E2F9E|nr:organic solute transporter subunit alpha-like [Lytechinus pictus]